MEALHESTSGFGPGICHQCKKEFDQLNVKKELDFRGGILRFCTIACYKEWVNRRWMMGPV